MAHTTTQPNATEQTAISTAYPALEELPLPDIAPRTTATVPVSASRPPASIGMRPELAGVGTTGVGGGAVWYTCMPGGRPCAMEFQHYGPLTCTSIDLVKVTVHVQHPP